MLINSMWGDTWGISASAAIKQAKGILFWNLNWRDTCLSWKQIAKGTLLSPSTRLMSTRQIHHFLHQEPNLTNWGFSWSLVEKKCCNKDKFCGHDVLSNHHWSMFLYCVKTPHQHFCRHRGRGRNKEGTLSVCLSLSAFLSLSWLFYVLFSLPEPCFLWFQAPKISVQIKTDHFVCCVLFLLLCHLQKMKLYYLLLANVKRTQPFSKISELVKVLPLSYLYNKGEADPV